MHFLEKYFLGATFSLEGITVETTKGSRPVYRMKGLAKPFLNTQTFILGLYFSGSSFIPRSKGAGNHYWIICNNNQIRIQEQKTYTIFYIKWMKHPRIFQMYSVF